LLGSSPPASAWLLLTDSRLTPQVEQYRSKMAVAGYDQKVPENVRILNQEKLAGYESELQTTEAALEGLKSMMKK
jgi:hypothetical protein